MNAELCSVLCANEEFSSHIVTELSLEQIVGARDTSTPHEERVTQAQDVARTIRENTLLGSWLPFHTQLPDLEYSNKFYPGYRDHTIHSLQVYLLGWYFYLNCGPLHDSIVQLLRLRGTDGGTLSDLEIFREWWTTTALWHDWGYPFEATAIISKSNFRAQLLERLSQERDRSPVNTTRLTGGMVDHPKGCLRELRNGPIACTRLVVTVRRFVNSWTRLPISRGRSAGWQRVFRRSGVAASIT